VIEKGQEARTNNKMRKNPHRELQAEEKGVFRATKKRDNAHNY